MPRSPSAGRARFDERLHQLHLGRAGIAEDVNGTPVAQGFRAERRERDVTIQIPPLWCASCQECATDIAKYQTCQISNSPSPVNAPDEGYSPMKLIAFFKNKGGVGKTTLVVKLAAHFELKFCVNEFS
jgi:Mrp family chromosome partitioning ATPase